MRLHQPPTRAGKRRREIGEIAAAAQTFQQAAAARSLVERNQQQIVSELSEGLRHLAFPEEYEELRRNYNTAVNELAEVGPWRWLVDEAAPAGGG